ncbi:TPA: molecular chaperone TorD family protein [Morganella morganii]|uniref:molecular chaperone TorD family protein n=1 Tax=Morganella morganii TaxID=582 RepID=UPI00196876FC|nr:molecular chaperone TorD family protein [Morganella morganii]
MSKTAHYAAAFNVLGICYLFPPDDDSNRAAMRLFTLPGFAQQWPCEVDNTLCSQLSRTAGEGTEVLKSAWQSLFAGPGALPAPPWGSVYLDAEGLLQGDSTLALSTFLKQERLKLNTPYPEPADHIGLILFQAAVLASEMRSAAVNTLLSQHLMNWLPRYAQRLDTHGHSPFYSALTRLALATVQSFIKA